MKQQKKNDKLIILWDIYNKTCLCKFNDFFENIENVKIIYSDNTEFLDIIKTNKEVIKTCSICLDYETYSKNNIYKDLILKKDIINIVNNNINKYEKHDYISIHIRNTDHINLRKLKNIVCNNDDYFKFIDTNLKKNYKLYIASDNKESYDIFYNKYKEYIPYYSFNQKKDLNLLHIKDNTQHHRHTDILDAIIDIYMCLKSKKFKGTSYSSYSDLINKLIKENN